MPTPRPDRASPASQTTRPPARHSAAVIPPFVLAGLVDYARAQGVSPEPWFGNAGISVEQCYEPDVRVSFRQIALVLRRALAALPEAGVGLAVGSRESLASFGLLGFAMMASRNFGEAVAVALEHHQLSGSLMDVSMSLEAGESVLLLDERFPEPDLLVFVVEEAFASVLAICRTLLGVGYRPLRLELTYPPPPWAEDYRRVFGCPVRFGAEANRYVTDPVWLERRLATHNPSGLAEALRLCASQTDKAEPRADLVMALELWLRGRLMRRPTAAEAAEVFHVTERTLRRRLSALDTSFQRVHDRVRAARAEVLLRSASLRVEDLAMQLGFSEAREFRRAYKRWTGHAPRG